MICVTVLSSFSVIPICTKKQLVIQIKELKVHLLVYQTGFNDQAQ